MNFQPWIEGLPVLAVVYRITNKISGKFYVGSTFHLVQRIRQHFNKNQWIRYANSVGMLYKDMQSVGVDHFAVDVLETFISTDMRQDIKKLEAIESKWTKDLRACEVGYNVLEARKTSDGWRGSGGMHTTRYITPEGSKRMLLGKTTNPEYGILKVPEEVTPPPTPKKVKPPKGVSKYARVGENNPFYGKKHTPEEIQRALEQRRIKCPDHGARVSAAKKGRHRGADSWRSRSVRCVETGGVYVSITAAGEAIGAKRGGNIWHAIKTGCTCGGYHWEYVDTPKPTT